MKEEVAIYGVGAFGKIFQEAIKEKIDFFIDDFSKDNFYKNYPIKKISEVKTKNVKIYISVLQSSHKIEKDLESLGFTNIINFTEAIKIIPNILEYISKKDYLWLQSDKSKLLDLNELDKVFPLLSDDKSKEILQQIINLRTTFDTKYYIDPQGTTYFPEDLSILKGLDKLRFVDCGAYDGDSVEEVLKQSPFVQYSLAFEPDDKNFNKLEKRLELLKENYPKSDLKALKFATYSSDTILKWGGGRF